MLAINDAPSFLTFNSNIQTITLTPSESDLGAASVKIKV